jgi:ribose transport system permease protein
MPRPRRAGEPGALWKNARESLSHAGSAIIIYLVLLAMICVLGVISPNFLSPALIGNLFITALPLVFAAIAQTVIVLIKGIDLSLGSIISLVMCVAASLMQDSALSIVTVFLLCIAIGVAAEVINGLFVVYARLQSIIVTLATSLIFGGVALYVMPQPGGYVPESLLTILSGSVGPIPNSAIILIACLVFIWLPVRKSRFGIGWYAVGGNESGAYFSGVNVNLAKMSAFVVAGVFAALSGVVLAAQTLTGDAAMGAPYTLNSIAACVLGGASLAGGIGGAVGTVGGAFVLTIFVDVLFFFKVSAYFQYVFSGAIVIVALAIVSISDWVRSRRAKTAFASAARASDR